METSLDPPLVTSRVFFEPTRKRFQDRSATARPSLHIDAKGLISEVEGHARMLLEYAPDQEIEPCFFSHIHSKNQYQVMRDVADMIVHGKRVATWFLRMRTGRKRWQWYRAHAVNELDSEKGAICVRLSEATPER